MSAASPVERLVSAFTAYAVGALPGLLTTANLGQAVTAPAFRRIEKTVRMESQYFPAVGINLDSVRIEPSGQGSIRVECEVDVFALATATKPELLSTCLDRYLDTIVDLGSGASLAGATGFEAIVTSADKGHDPDGMNGWVAVSFTVWGEAPF